MGGFSARVPVSLWILYTICARYVPDCSKDRMTRIKNKIFLDGFSVRWHFFLYFVRWIHMARPYCWFLKRLRRLLRRQMRAFRRISKSDFVQTPRTRFTVHSSSYYSFAVIYDDRPPTCLSRPTAFALCVLHFRLIGRITVCTRFKFVIIKAFFENGGGNSAHARRRRLRRLAGRVALVLTRKVIRCILT